jgi:hypothetical protein
MASWTLLEAASGYQYDATQETLTFVPRLASEDFRSFFITGSGWGVFSQQNGTAQISLDYGSLSLKSLTLGASAGQARVTLGEQSVKVEAKQADGRLTLSFAQPVMLAAGESLTVTV